MGNSRSKSNKQELFKLLLIAQVRTPQTLWATPSSSQSLLLFSQKVCLAILPSSFLESIGKVCFIPGPQGLEFLRPCETKILFYASGAFISSISVPEEREISPLYVEQ